MPKAFHVKRMASRGICSPWSCLFEQIYDCKGARSGDKKTLQRFCAEQRKAGSVGDRRNNSRHAYARRLGVDREKARFQAEPDLCLV